MKRKTLCYEPGKIQCHVEYVGAAAKVGEHTDLRMQSSEKMGSKVFRWVPEFLSLFYPIGTS